MRRPLWLALSLVVGIATRAGAQGVPSTVSCNDRDGHAVTGAPVTNGVFAKASTDANGKPVIEYDARSIPGIRAQVHLFVYAHECGHHALGHDLRGSITPAQEHDADCYGIRLLMNKAGVTSDDVRTLQEDMEALGPGDVRRLPWMKRAYDLVACVPRAPDAAAAVPVNPLDACVIHRDEDNQIVTQSRDGRSITALYSVANRCAQDVTCTVTIEVGTLADIDADAGSFARFHLLKTRTETHPLNAGSNGEFRFQETIDSVPAGESIDYRVRTSCR